MCQEKSTTRYDRPLLKLLSNSPSNADPSLAVQDTARRLLGVSQPIVSDYERGELRLHGELIIQLTKILEVTADEILGLESTKSNNSVKI